MRYVKLIADLDSSWDDDGFLANLREGVYDEREGERFLALLRSISIDDDDVVPKRLISLLWCLPSFLIWQRSRVSEAGNDTAAYQRFVAQVHNALEMALGTP